MNQLNEEIKVAIINYLLKNPNGSNSVEIASKIGFNRITVGKYLQILKAHKIVDFESIGKAKQWKFRKEENSILLIDDDKQLHGLLKLLGKNKFKLISAFNGEEGLEKSYLVDLIILDLMMPKMSGLEVLKIIKSNPILKNKPLIVLSASTNFDQKIKTILERPDDYISKPFDPLELEAKIDLMLSNKKANVNSLTDLPGKILFINRFHSMNKKDIYLTHFEILNLNKLRKNSNNLNSSNISNTYLKLIKLVAKMLANYGDIYHIDTFNFYIFSKKSVRDIDFSSLKSIIPEILIQRKEYNMKKLNNDKKISIIDKILK